MSPSLRRNTQRIATTLALIALGCLPRREQPEDSPSAPAATSKTSDLSGQESKLRKNGLAIKDRRRRADPKLVTTFRDDFERQAIGPGWHATGKGWRVQDGRLCGKRARNRPIWLKKRLPVNAVIQFDATSYSPEGDIKAEFWGDGASGATTTSYKNATSYLTIFGGWKNQLHVLARLDEHSDDRRATRVSPGATLLSKQPVVAQRTYKFRVQRQDGMTVQWYVDDVEMHSFKDTQPLVGAGHDHFGFNDWDARVCFDNLVVEPIAAK